MNSRRLWIAISVAIMIAACAVIIILFSSRTDIKNEHVIRVGYKPNSGYQNYFVALSQKYFDKHGVSVEGTTFQSTSQMLLALALGQIDATPAGSIEVVARMAQDYPEVMRIYLTLVFHKDNAFFSVVAPKDSPIKTLADLKGKRVGTIPGTTATAWLKFCIKNFFDTNEVEILQMDLRIQLQALSVGEVDALYTVDPIVTMAQVNGIADVVVKGPENEYILNPMATGAGLISTKFLKEELETSRRFIAAMYDAIDFMRTNEKQTRQIITTYTKLDVDVADRMDLIGYWEIDETNYEIVQKYLDFLLEHGILDKQIDAESLYMDHEVMKQ